MTKTVTIKESKPDKEYDMLWLKKLRISCDAVSATGACGVEKSLQIKRIGARAKAIIEESIGLELEELDNKIEAYLKKLGKTKMTFSELQNHPDLAELHKVKGDQWKKKAPFSFISVVVDTQMWEEKGLDFSERFPLEPINIMYGNEPNVVLAFKEFGELEELGVIKIQKQ